MRWCVITGEATILDMADSLTTPSSRRLPLLLMALALALLCLWGGSRGQLIPGLPFKDADDVLRMLQVLALHDGGGWYDLTQHRIDPPAGLAMHWSRLPDLPLLGVLTLAEPWLGRDEAIRLAATLVPALLGVGYFFAFVWAARPLTGLAGGPQAGLIALAAFMPLLSFSAGRIDHHGWQLLLALLQAGAVLRVAAGERRLGPLILAGLAAALGLWVGAEAIPVLAFSALALTLLWWREGTWVAARLAWFGLVALAGCLALLPLALAPGQRLAIACDAFSWLSVALTAAVALFGAGAALAERARGGLSPGRRAGLTLLLGLPLLVLLGTLFPHCLASPYGEVSPAAARLAARTGESQPLGLLLTTEPAAALYFLTLPLAALILVSFRGWRSTGREKNPWLALGALLGGSLILPWWQFRGIHLANVLAALALTWPAAALGTQARLARGLGRRVALRAGPAILVALLPGAIALLAAAGSGWRPPPRSADCELEAALAVLNQGPDRHQAPLLIAAPINLGASILWATPHAILAGPYHRNAAGLRDIEAILEGDEASAREAVARRGVDFLILCRPSGDGAGDNIEADPGFVGRLLAGEVPPWLVSVPVEGGAHLFRMKAPQAERESPGP